MKSLHDIPRADAGEEIDLNSFDHVAAYLAHGPIYKVRFRGEDWVCMGGLDANDLAWRTPDSWSYEKAMTPFTEVMGPTHVTQLDKEAHRKERRNLKPGFAMSNVIRWIPTMDEVIASSLEAIAGKQTELHNEIMRMLTTANCRTTACLDLKPDELQDFIDFEEDFIGNTFRETEDRKAYYARPEFVALKERVLGHCRRVALARLEGERCEDNLQDMLDDRAERGITATPEELTSEIYLLVMAGTGNTAKTINSGLQHMLERPDWLEQLREELTAYSPEAMMEGMKAFPKLKATILEMERIFPAAPVLPRCVAAPIEFGGYLLETGTKVLHLHTLTHFLEEIYPDPYTFKPERWLDATPPRKAHGTFGGGTHICLGINLARLHLPIFLGNLLGNYDFESIQQPEIRVQFQYGVPQSADLELTLIPRSSSHALSS